MNHCTKDGLIAFETEIKLLWEAGELRHLLHLCGGNEDELIRIFRMFKAGDWIFSTHRSHYHALLAGIEPANLRAMIEQGHSMFVFDKARNFLTSSVLAGTCAIAVGVAWALRESKNREHVWCFLGDGAEEQGHFYEAVMMAAGHELPVTFIIEDNNRSVDTTKPDRRGCGSLGTSGFQMDWPREYVIRYHYTPTYPHAGSGCKHHIEFKK